MSKSSLQLLDDLIIEIESSLNTKESVTLNNSANVSLPSNTTATTIIALVDDDDAKASTKSSSLSESGQKTTSDLSVGQKQPKIATDTKPVTTKQKPTKSKNDSTTNSTNVNEDNESLSINSIDLRVGIIRSVKRHDTAEKLYVEEIDVGEETYRPIASGLVPYYTLEQMQGRRLIVVCNLKPRNLVGFKSHGMFITAACDMMGACDHTVQ
jgi:aminoacyl tRNA synthase complex-interacting multifunctional protein 1